MHLSAGTTELHHFFDKGKSASLCSGANTAQLHHNRHRKETERERENWGRAIENIEVTNGR